MSDIRFYGEGKCEYTRQMFLSEEGVFYWGTRKGLIEDYRQRYPDRHLMVYLYSQGEYERNRQNELGKLQDKFADTAHNIWDSPQHNRFVSDKVLSEASRNLTDAEITAYDSWYADSSIKASITDREWNADVKRALGFDFAKDNGIER